MPNSTSSNITSAIRTRRSNKQNRHRNDIYYIMNHPTFTNIFYYAKYLFFKSHFGPLVLFFMFIGLLHVFFFSQFQWPKFVKWLHNSTITTISNEF